MKIALIDNYDSFTFNIFHYLKNKKCEVEIFRNDKFKINKFKILIKLLFHQVQETQVTLVNV